MSDQPIPEMRDGRYYQQRLGSKKSDAKKKRDEERKAREFLRKFGSVERVWYVAEHLACSVPGCRRGPNDNAHGATGGVGYKADSTTVLPLCTGMDGHHRELHAIGAETFQAKHGVDLEAAAADTESSWRLYGPDIVAAAKQDGRFQRWLERSTEAR